jgi:2-phospho-L-lactate guanylyltransferase
MNSALQLPGQAPAFRPWAIVPAKALGRAKSRLDRAIGVAERQRLARELIARVLRACTRCDALAGILVATDGDDVARIALAAGARVVRDQGAEPTTLAAIVDHALLASTALGATHGLVLMADLPLLEARDVSELVWQLRQSPLLIAPDAQRRGTSALGVQLGLGIRSCFGYADSLQRHTRESLRVGARLLVSNNPRVSRDLDTIEDLVRLQLGRASTFTERSTP